MNLDGISVRIDDALTHQSLDAEDYADKAWAVVPDAARLLAIVDAVTKAAMSDPKGSRYLDVISAGLGATK